MADNRRLARLARLREVERRRAAEQAAEAGSHHERLRLLAERSGELVAGYNSRGNAIDGAALGALLAFRSELAALRHQAAGDAEVAGRAAEQARLALSAAQRRRDLVDERLETRRRNDQRRADAGGEQLARRLRGSGVSALTSDRTAR